MKYGALVRGESEARLLIKVMSVACVVLSRLFFKCLTIISQGSFVYEMRR